MRVNALANIQVLTVMSVTWLRTTSTNNINSYDSHMTWDPAHCPLTLRYMLVPVDSGVVLPHHVPRVIGGREVLWTQVCVGEGGDHVGANGGLEETAGRYIGTC